MNDENRIDEASLESFPASDPPTWTLGAIRPGYRTEWDSMGRVQLPQDALYGAQTQRAVNNFEISSYRLQPRLIKSLGLIKACAARVNAQLGALDLDAALAIESAADSIAEGGHFDQFVVDVFQTGSGTSTNMNANEVIAMLSHCHPNDQVNRSQSSNDVIPAALHIAAAVDIHQDLLPAMDLLSAALETKALQYAEIQKIGRTHLRNATPISLGQELSGYVRQVRACSERILSALDGLYELPIGGTAVGTGFNAPAHFGTRMTELIANRTGLPFREATNHFEAQAAKDAVLFMSGALKTYAVALSKIANDIRWLGSEEIDELRLPPLQPGSSIMPGKVNPVIPESVLMICAQVIGHDTAITWGCASGNFELNTMIPLLAFDLLDSIQLLAAGTRNFATRCIEGIEAAGQQHRPPAAQHLTAMATAIAGKIGYDTAARIVNQVRETGESFDKAAAQITGLSESTIGELIRTARSPRDGNRA